MYYIMVLILFAFICVLIVGLLFSFAVIRKEEEFKEINFSIYYGVALFLFGLLLITRANEWHLHSGFSFTKAFVEKGG